MRICVSTSVEPSPHIMVRILPTNSSVLYLMRTISFHATVPLPLYLYTNDFTFHAYLLVYSSRSISTAQELHIAHEQQCPLFDADHLFPYDRFHSPSTYIRKTSLFVRICVSTSDFSNVRPQSKIVSVPFSSQD